MSQKINLNIKKNNDFYVLFTYKVDNISVDFTNYTIAGTLYTTDEVTIVDDFNITLANNGRLILDLDEAQVNALDLNTVYKYRVFLTDINNASIMPFYGDVLVYNDYMTVDQRADYDYVNTLAQIIEEKVEVDGLIAEAREAADEAIAATDYALQVANDVIAITVNAIAAANEALVYANNALTYRNESQAFAAQSAANAVTANTHANTALTYRNQANVLSQSANASAQSANNSAIAANNHRIDIVAMKASVDASVTAANNSATASAGFAAQSAANAVTANTHANTALTHRNAANTSAVASAASATQAASNALSANTSSAQAAAAATAANGHQVAANTFKNQANASATSANASALAASDSAAQSAGSASAANTSALAANTSATQASNSANAASTSASQAAANTSAALTYRNQANSSAQAANTSAIAADGSAVSAANSAALANTLQIQANTFMNQANASAILANTHQVNANTFKNQATANATAAAASALAANTSANNAAASAVAANGSATSAGASASAAAGSATAANTSASRAAANAVTANTHANTALTHRNAANTSAGQAAANAASAASSASDAATSATQAAGNVAAIAAHASNALTYRNQAQANAASANTSAAAAAGSAAGAAGSATLAANSANRAAASETAANTAAANAQYYYELVANAGNVIIGTTEEARIYRDQANASAISANNTYNSLVALSNTSVVPGTIPVRTATGTVKASNPTANDDLVTLAYANNTYLAKVGNGTISGTLDVNGGTIMVDHATARNLLFRNSNNVNRGSIIHEEGNNRFVIRTHHANGATASNFYVNADGSIVTGTNEVYHQGNFNPGNYATLASPTFTGDPKAPTAAFTDSDTSIATTAFVHAYAAAFGLGKASPSNGLMDLDTATVGSFIAVNGTALEGKSLNWPDRGAVDTNAEWWNVLTIGSTARATQIASFGFTSGGSATYIRTKHDTTWLAWRRISFIDEVVSRSGDSMTGSLSFTAGSAAAPGINFGTVNSGVWGTGVNVYIASSGVNRFTVNTAQITTTVPIRGTNGTVTAPAFTFTGDNNSGMYWIAADTLGFTTGGTESVRIDATGNLTANGQVRSSTAAPVAVNDLTRKDYVDGSISAAQANVQSSVDALASRQIISGNGILGGGNLTASRTLYIQDGVGLTSNTIGVHVMAGTDIVANTTGVHVGTGVARTSRQVISGNGLTGGGNLTADRTLSVQAGNGLLANTTGVHINPGNGLLANSTLVYVGAGNGISVNATAVAIDAGTDIVANSTGVHVGTGVTRTSRQVISGNGILGGGNFTADRTLYIQANNGLVANATGLFVVAGTDIVSNATGVHVGTGVVRTGVTITAGNGLTGGGNLTANRTLSVQAGSSMVANSTGIHLADVITGSKVFSGVIESQSSVYIKANPTNNNAHLWFHNSANTEKGLIYCDTSTGSVMLRANTTQVFSFTFAGNFTAPGDIMIYSDERLKSNIVTIPGKKAMDMINGISGKSYVKDGKPTYGVIAQEIQKVAPELVYEQNPENDQFVAKGESPTLAVTAGNGLTAILIEAIKHLNEKIDSLEAKIDKLEGNNK